MSFFKIISELLDRRLTKVTALKKVQEGLAEFTVHLEDLKKLAVETSREPDDTVPTPFKQAVTAVPQQVGTADQEGSLQSKVSKLRSEVNKIIERFQKDTINIGVMGSPKQGKSTILQKISGLTDNEIPSASGQPLTRAKSRIYHLSQGTPYAEIVFYTKEEFLKEIVWPYYEKLGVADKRPKNMEEFRNPLPQLDIGDGNTLNQAIYQKLDIIHRGFNDFSTLLSKPAKRIEMKDIRNYVADNENKSPLHLAVKVANIYNRFPNEDASGLCFVDLPGLEQVAQDQEKLTGALEREVDAVLLLKMPPKNAAVWNDEYEAVSLISRSLKQVELADWLFIVLNETLENKDQIKTLIRSNTMPLHSRPQILVADCSKAKEVTDKVFSPVLQHLAQHLSRIDKRYVQFLVNDLESVRSSLIDLEQPVRRFLSSGGIIDDGDLRLFRTLFTRFFNKLKTDLQKLVGELRVTESGENRQKFDTAVIELCDQAEQSPPVLSVEELTDRFYDKGGWPAAVQDQLHILRAHLTQHLCRLDNALQEMLSETLQKVLSRILSEEILNSLLSELANSGQSQLDRLRKFQELFNQHEHQHLYEAFTYLTNFHFSYHSHFHYRVREEMGPLDPMLDPNIIIEIATAGGATSEGAENVANGLLSHYKEAVFGVRKKLQGDMVVDPSRAIFALIEEFRDRAVWTQDIDNEWESFLSIHRGQIWPVQFGKREKFRQLLGRWQKTINDAIGCATKIRADFDI
ncbi:MAG: hypothetical protein BWK78_01860 [Thiotrichaceae bacterium IS1]|nr:MAG: hypothetical protein BWK78_01860 [Thiotrichaceae bacterium IS1]